MIFELSGSLLHVTGVYGVVLVYICKYWMKLKQDGNNWSAWGVGNGLIDECACNFSEDCIWLKTRNSKWLIDIYMYISSPKIFVFIKYIVVFQHWRFWSLFAVRLFSGWNDLEEIIKKMHWVIGYVFLKKVLAPGQASPGCMESRCRRQNAQQSSTVLHISVTCNRCLAAMFVIIIIMSSMPLIVLFFVFVPMFTEGWKGHTYSKQVWYRQTGSLTQAVLYEDEHATKLGVHQSPCLWKCPCKCSTISPGDWQPTIACQEIYQIQ